MQTRPSEDLVDNNRGFGDGGIEKKPSTNKHSILGLLPHKHSSSGTFKGTKSDVKRFSTPQPQRVQREEEYKGTNLVRRRSMLELRPPLNCIPPPHSHKRFHSSKCHDKRIRKRASSWSKLVNCVGGKVSSVDIINDDLLVDLSKLFLGFRFAHGAHSQLYHGVYNDEAVAVKIIRVRDEDENEELGIRLEKQFIREVYLLSRLHHQNVIKFVAAYRQPPTFCVITEYLSEGSLRAYLHKLENNTIPYNASLAYEKIISMALDIARGMEYVHSRGVIHRDLKPENILVTKDFELKIADFGIGREEGYCDVVSDDPGTYRWMAPEMIKKKPYDRKVDVYGFGLILWEMVAGALPYKGLTPIQAAFAVVHKRLRPSIPIDCPPAMQTLMELCWSSNPHKRPEFSQVVKVLEEFESSLARDGNLNVLQYPICFDRRKSHRQSMQKQESYHQQMNSPTPKPRFS